MKNFFTRLASGTVFVVLMVGGILWNEYSFLLLMTFILAGSMSEYFIITTGKREGRENRISVKWFVMVLSAVYYWKAFVLSSPPASGAPSMASMAEALFHGLMSLRDSNFVMNATIPVFIFLLFIYELFAESENPFGNVGWNAIAVFWILVPLLLTNKIYFGYGGYFLVAVFALIWLYDSASYVVGSLVGKTPLFPRISPKKTIEGLIGGVVVTLAAAWFINHIPHLNIFSNIEWVFITALIIIGATFGDLVESMLKRSLNIKDSGRIMPGHGGFLDRFDAYFFAVPFLAVGLWMIAEGQNMMLILNYLK